LAAAATAAGFAGLAGLAAADAAGAAAVRAEAAGTGAAGTGAEAECAGAAAAGVAAACPLPRTVPWFLVAASLAADFAMFVKAELNLDELLGVRSWSAVGLGPPPAQGAAPQTAAIAAISPAAPATAFHFEGLRMECRAL
jgi:hypothetical protein